MTRPKLFILSSAIIFVLERVLSIMAPWPIFIFPVFVILYILLNPSNTPTDLLYVALTAAFFDFFSGFTFGWLTIAILAVFLTIYLAKTFLNISGRSQIFTLALSLIFVFEYFFLLSIKISPRLVISQTPIILAESIILLIPIRFFLQKFLNPKP